jgi:hypothetical protein
MFAINNRFEMVSCIQAWFAMRPANTNPSDANGWNDHLTMNYFGSLENVKSIEIRLM